MPFFETRKVLTYKAKNIGKHICLVSPAYTSQIDSVSGIKEGTGKGIRFYVKNGLVYDADINVAINITQKSKHPISQGNLLDGQGINYANSGVNVLQTHPISFAVGVLSTNLTFNFISVFCCQTYRSAHCITIAIWIIFPSFMSNYLIYIPCNST